MKNNPISRMWNVPKLNDKSKGYMPKPRWYAKMKPMKEEIDGHPCMKWPTATSVKLKTEPCTMEDEDKSPHKASRRQGQLLNATISVPPCSMSSIKSKGLQYIENTAKKYKALQFSKWYIYQLLQRMLQPCLVCCTVDHTKQATVVL